MSYTRGARSGGFPKPGELRGDMPGRHSRDGWECIGEHTSIQLQGKQYRNMKEWSRPCAICGVKFSIYEKSGSADANSRFGNKTCEVHRNLLAAVEKGYLAWSTELNGMVPGPKCVSGDVSIAGNEELDQLRMWKSCVSEELKELDELRRENAKFKKESLVSLRQRVIEAKQI